MKFDWVFLRTVVIGYAALTTIAFLLLSHYAEPEHVNSAVAGSLVSLTNFFLGFFAIQFSFEKSHTTFLKVVLGGMVARLMAMSAVVVVLVKLYGFETLSLMLSLLGFYVVNLTFEIAFLQKKVSLKGRS